MVYNATYATLRARGVKDAIVHRATVVIIRKAQRLNRTTASVTNAFKAA